MFKIGTLMQPAYDRIYFDLKRDIETHVFGFKEYLPSEAELCKRYGCAHNTVRKAIAALASNGYVQPVHGKGVRVILQPTPFGMDAHTRFSPNVIESFQEVGKQFGFEVSTKVLLMETVTVDQALFEQTGFDLGADVVHLERVRSFNDVPSERETNFFRADVVEGMTPADAEASIYRYIEDVRNVKLVTCKRYATLQPVNERDRELLEVGDATHVAVVSAQTFDGEGLLCEVSQVRWRPEVFSASTVAIRTRLNQNP